MDPSWVLKNSPAKAIASSARFANASPEMARWIISTVSSAKASPGGGRKGEKAKKPGEMAGFLMGKSWRTSSINAGVFICFHGKIMKKLGLSSEIDLYIGFIHVSTKLTLK